MKDPKECIEAALDHEIVRDVIDEQAGNLTQKHFQKCALNRRVIGELAGFARKAAEIILKDETPPPDRSHPDWKTAHANAVCAAMKSRDFEALIDQVIARMRRRFSREVEDRADFRYPYWKIGNYVGQVSRMLRHGLDPNLLLMSDEEAEEDLRELAESARASGVPTVVVDPTSRGGRSN